MYCVPVYKELSTSSQTITRRHSLTTQNIRSQGLVSGRHGEKWNSFLNHLYTQHVLGNDAFYKSIKLGPAQPINIKALYKAYTLFQLVLLNSKIVQLMYIAIYFTVCTTNNHPLCTMTCKKLQIEQVFCMKSSSFHELTIV